MTNISRKPSVVLAVASFCVLLAASLPAYTQQVDPQLIVIQNFPQSLIDKAQKDGSPWGQHFCFAVYDRFPSGAPRTIMAAYSNDVSGAVRVIQADAAGNYGVAFEPQDLHLRGADCVVGLKDVDGDGRAEVVVSFTSIKGNSVDWLFQWNGSQLVSMGPDQLIGDTPEPGPFFNMSFLDLYHDGTLQVAGGGEYPPPIDGSLPLIPGTLYRLNGGKYVEVGPLFLGGSYERGKGSPVVSSVWFQLSRTASGPYRIQLSNGATNGSRRVSSAHVVLNGTEVVSPRQLNQTVGSIEVPVDLLPNNNLQVMLEGDPGSGIAVAVMGGVNQTTP